MRLKKIILNFFEIIFLLSLVFSIFVPEVFKIEIKPIDTNSNFAERTRFSRQINFGTLVETNLSFGTSIVDSKTISFPSIATLYINSGSYLLIGDPIYKIGNVIVYSTNECVVSSIKKESDNFTIILTLTSNSRVIFTSQELLYKGQDLYLSGGGGIFYCKIDEISVIDGIIYYTTTIINTHKNILEKTVPIRAILKIHNNVMYIDEYFVNIINFSTASVLVYNPNSGKNNIKEVLFSYEKTRNGELIITSGNLDTFDLIYS
jgi:hypothetical protein